MKKLSGLLALLICTIAFTQEQKPNLIVITTDGFRWQDLFRGMDTAIASQAEFNEGDSNYLYQTYWSPDLSERRQKLLPFIWGTLAQNGQIYGNRDAGCNVDNANPYWFSYPGYNEIFTGFPDTAINTNSYPPNPHVTVLEFLHRQPGFRNKVAAFGAWEAFDRILNESRSGIPVFSAFDPVGGQTANPRETLINRMLQSSYKPWHKEECLDLFTHHAAMEWLQSRKPRVLYIAYGETDEWAHAGQYRSYLDAAHQVDQWIREIWEYVQSDPFYRNKTRILITTDHGRGDIVKKEWTSHNNKIRGASEIWLAAMGPGLPARGEVKMGMQLYQQQLAQTMARLLGQTYKASHPVAAEITEIFK